MIITVRNDYRIEAELTENELTEYGITYDELDYGNIETRRVLWHMLDDIRKKSGAGLDFSGKLLIEVMKESSEKFLFCFTCLSHGKDSESVKQLVKSENPPVCAQFSDFEDVLKAVAYMDSEKVSSLYEKNGSYRLTAELNIREKQYFSRISNEFGECLSDTLRNKAECTEHWSCLIEDNALKVLSEVFSVKQY